MTIPNKIPSGSIYDALHTLSRGDEQPLKIAGMSEPVIQDIRHILNIYAKKIPPVIYEIIVSSLKTHAPSTALLRLEQFLNTSGTDINIPSGESELPDILAAVFSTSGALSGRLNSDSTLLDGLAAINEPLAPRLKKDYYLKHIDESFHEGDVLSERIKKIHRLQSIHLMRICARNTDPQVSISEISTELSSLAEAVITLCLECAADELFSQIGIPARPHTLVVLGLGKLGGSELNVSSDIDIIYLCSDQESMWGQHDSISFHTMLAERLTRLLTEATAQGTLYRVDTRLRADGASGPLVRTTRDYFRYLELRGEGWERQMLLKARPVAGDYSVAEDFLKSVERFIFPSTITRSPNREIVALKNQIEARLMSKGSKKTHLKLMEGGIRDIEFIVQCLQLLMGGIHHEVRSACTLTALERLRELNALNNQEYNILSEAYRFYRRVENALQWRELLPAFTIPSTREEIEVLEKFLGLESKEHSYGSMLTYEIEKKRTAVRAIYNEIFSAEGYGSFEEMALYTAIAPAGNEKVTRFLENLGFNYPVESARNIAGLVFEKTPGVTEAALHPSTERFLPKLLRALSDLPDPSGALERFKRVAESYSARYTLFDILENNATFLELLLTLAHGSVFITDILVEDPSLLDWLFEMAEILHPFNMKEFKQELSRIDSASRDNTSFTKSCLTAKNREKLRIGARDINGLSTTAATFSELTKTGEAVVRAVYTRSYRELSAAYPVLRRDYEFSVITAGRLGAEIMNFGSDLDLIFVYTAGPKSKDCIEIPEYSVKLARYILSLITGGGGANKIYDVDARLRPEGGNAVLAISLDEYRKYLEHRASEWERLALIRARALAGSTRLGREIMNALHSFVYRGPFTGTEVKRIIDIRTAMTESSLKRYPGLVNIKSGPGGITDIDFIAQTYAAHSGSDKHGVRKRETTAILSGLVSERIIERHDASTLTELYTFLNDVEKVIRISSGKAVNTVPASGTELARVARLLSFKNVRRFEKRLNDVRSLTREYYERMMKELLDRADNVKPES